MQENDISIVDLSKETGIDRTVVYRYIKGKRIPSDIETVIRIADALQMSVSEKKYLMDEYDKLTLGEPLVHSFQYVQNLFRQLDAYCGTDICSYKMWHSNYDFVMEHSVIALHGKEDICLFIQDLLRYVAGQQESCLELRMIMQLVYEDIQSSIIQNFSNHDIAVEQIVCLEQNRKHSHENLKVLQGILNLCFGLENYQVFYYYDSLGRKNNRMIVFPNIIILGDYVVQFDYYMENGVAVCDPVYVEMICQCYEEIKEDTKKLLMQGNDQVKAEKYILSLLHEDMGVVFREMCKGACIGREILLKRLKEFPGKQDLIKQIVNQHGDWNGKVYHVSMEKHVRSYGSKEEIHKFMETGLINEFPVDLYEPLSMDERILVLHRMIQLAKAKYMIYRFVDDAVYLPKHIQVYWQGKQKLIVINQIQKQSIVQVVVNEPSIYRTFQMYFEYLEKKGLLKGEQESLACLEQMLQEWEEKINV